jgi:hypothetical protein
MTRLHAYASALIVSSALAACGGSNSGGSQTPPSSGGTTPTNPCSTALEADQAPGLTGLVAGGESGAVSNKKILVDGNPRGRAVEALWLHDAAVAQRERISAGRQAVSGGASITSPAPVSEDVGEIAVLQDQGDLIAPANQFDLGGTGFRFTRNGSSGYSVAKIDANFRSNLGTQLTLTDDDSAQANVAFSFPFYGSSQTAAFVNTDGNITFGEADKASTERDVSRLISGAPRVALFLADLDPKNGGKIFVNAASDQYTVTWCGVHGFDSPRGVTAQVTLLPDGTIELKYGDSITLGDAVVGVSPGHTGAFTTMDLSQTNPSSGTGALGERFALATSLDNVAVARKFFQTHPDNYDQILIWTDQRLIRDAFAFELTVANEIRGLGVDIYDLSRDFGSGGQLRSVVVMDFVGKFPDDPNQKFLGENNTLSVMGQEVGHRWLAYMDFRDHNGARSDALLGRDLAHWSFFFDSDASVMEGNDIEDLGGGQFRTADAVKRYSRLDQYAMGLVPPSAVPPFFYVESPNSSHVREDAPQIGVTFSGTRRDVLIDDVIAIEGQRSPSSSESPRVHRQAFILLVSSGRSTDAAQVAKVDNIRRAWEPFFSQATENRMTAITRLR